ncbi:MAG: DUF6268 family outer membrane beta-barrel protein [Bacteroidota bacterium]
MIVRCLLSFGFAFFSFYCVAQDLPTRIRFCQPGVQNQSRTRGLEIAYQTNGRFGFQDDAGGNGDNRSFNDISSLEYSINIPILLKEDWKIFLGFRQRPETINLSENLFETAPYLEELDGIRLKSNSLRLLGVKSLDYNNYVAFTVILNNNGLYDGLFKFSDTYLNRSAAFIYGIEKSPDFEFGFGLAYDQNARRTLVLPIFFYNKTWSRKWGIEAYLPNEVMLRYNASPKTLLFSGLDFAGRSYGINMESITAVSDQGPIDHHFNHQAVQWKFSLEQEIIPWLWLGVEGGYQIPLSTQLRSLNPTQSVVKFTPSNNVFFRMGLFLSPPDH